MRDLNYELAPKPGMTASQRKAELDNARFVAVRNLAYMIYMKPDKTPLMTYQETLDNRELVKNAIIHFEISEGLLQNDLGTTAAPPSQSPQMIPQNGAQTMSQQPTMAPPMSYQPQAQAPMPPAQFAQMPMAQSQQPMQPQYAAPLQPQYAPQPQMPPQMQPQYAAPQMQAPQMQPQPGYAQQPMAAAPPPMESAPVTGKKRKTVAGNAVAPPPTGQQTLIPPSYIPQQPVPAQPAAVQVQQFQSPPPAPMQFQAPQPQMAPQQQMAPQPQGMSGDISQKMDLIGKGVEVAANNGDQALKIVNKLQAEIDELKTMNLQMMVCLHHLYLNIQNAGGQPLLAPATEGKAANIQDFRTYLQRYIGNPK